MADGLDISLPVNVIHRKEVKAQNKLVNIDLTYPNTVGLSRQYRVLRFDLMKQYLSVEPLTKTTVI